MYPPTICETRWSRPDPSSGGDGPAHGSGIEILGSIVKLVAGAGVLAGSAAAGGEIASGALAGALTPVGSLLPRASALAGFGCIGALLDFGLAMPLSLASKNPSGTFTLTGGLPS